MTDSERSYLSILTLPLSEVGQTTYFGRVLAELAHAPRISSLGPEWPITAADSGASSTASHPAKPWVG